MNRTFIVCILLSVALFFAVRYGLHQHAEKVRLISNQNTLLEQVQGELHSYRVRDSLNGVSNNVLSLRVSEFVRSFHKFETLLHDLGVKVRHVELLSQSGVRTNYRIDTPVLDTVLRSGAIVDSLSDTLATPIAAQVLHFRDAYLSLSGVIHGGRFYGDVQSVDTLIHVVHRVPHRFWFIRWGTKELRQEVMSTNPHTKITYNRTVKIAR